MDERGLYIHRTTQVLVAFGVPAVPDEENGNLISLWPLVAHVVFGTLTACDQIVEAIAHDIRFPPPVAPGYSVFIRGYHTESLVRLRRRYGADIASDPPVPPEHQAEQ